MEQLMTFLKRDHKVFNKLFHGMNDTQKKLALKNYREPACSLAEFVDSDMDNTLREGVKRLLRGELNYTKIKTAEQAKFYIDECRQTLVSANVHDEVPYADYYRQTLDKTFSRWLIQETTFPSVSELLAPTLSARQLDNTMVPSVIRALLQDLEP